MLKCDVILYFIFFLGQLGMTTRKTYLHALFTASYIFCTSFPTNYLKF